MKHQFTITNRIASDAGNPIVVHDLYVEDVDQGTGLKAKIGPSFRSPASATAYAKAWVAAFRMPVITFTEEDIDP